MSESAEPDEPGVLKRTYRTVTPGYRGREDVEMNAIGWGLLLGLVLILIPLAPFIVIVWFVGKMLDAVTPGEE